jgi:hypothetical protein
LWWEAIEADHSSDGKRKRSLVYDCLSYAESITEKEVLGDCMNMTTDERTIFAKLEALKEIR